MVLTRTITKDGRALVLRVAQGEDAEALLAYVETISGETDFLTFGPGEFQLTKAEEVAYLENCLRAPHCLYLLALIDGELAGTLTFTAGNRARTRHAGEFGLSVLRAFWGQGVASTLIDALLDWARQGGIVKKINLRVREDNHRAIALYERKGFVLEGRLRREIYFQETYYDNLWLGLVL